MPMVLHYGDITLKKYVHETGIDNILTKYYYISLVQTPMAFSLLVYKSS